MTDPWLLGFIINNRLLHSWLLIDRWPRYHVMLSLVRLPWILSTQLLKNRSWLWHWGLEGLLISTRIYRDKSPTAIPNLPATHSKADTLLHVPHTASDYFPSLCGMLTCTYIYIYTLHTHAYFMPVTTRRLLHVYFKCAVTQECKWYRLFQFGSCSSYSNWLYCFSE